MPGDPESVSISRVVFISHNDNLIVDEAARANLTSFHEPDLQVRLGEHSPDLGQQFVVYFKGHAPEVQVTTPPPPPRQAQLLLRYALPLKDQEHIIGDLEETYYTEWLPEHPRHAQRLYWSHAMRSIAPILWIGVRRSAIITAILGAADWLRDRFG